VFVVVVVVEVLVVKRFSNPLNFSVSQPIVIKLRLLIGDNIPDFRIVSWSFKLSPETRIMGLSDGVHFTILLSLC